MNNPGRGRSRGGGRGGRGGGRTNGRAAFGGRGPGGGICHQWRDMGTCRYGSSCKFAHIGAGRQVAGLNRSQINRSLDETANFIKHLSALPRQRLDHEIAESATLWKRCWQEHAILNNSVRRKLLEILATTPGSSVIDPPPIDLCQQVAATFLKENASGDGVVLAASKTVLDVVARLLLFEWDCTRDEVIKGLEKMILGAESNLDKRNKEHRNVATRLMNVLEDLEKSWRIKIREVHDTVLSIPSEPSLALTFADWKTADIQWLSNPTFFAPSCCPKMQVAENGVYSSSDHYLGTLHHLWVAMTFADGHAALAPHCRSRGQKGSCNNALWPIVRHSGQAIKNLRCRSTGCTRPVEFTCRIASHDALCSECAVRSISRHLQGPGPSASTHIYDCKVKHVDPDGIVYLQDFKSRNPPASIHWSTTKRLSPPNLVGIVLVRTTGAALSERDKILWGEVTYHGHNRDEDRRRQNGELAINIASIVNVDPDLFGENSSVVVIDCMSFVPEWIPVLKALESQQNSRLPFDNGKHLNLWKDDPVSFSSCMDGVSPDNVFNAPRATVIEEMVRDSSLEPIRDIRVDPSLRDELVIQLEQLVSETTLDQMQFLSFLDSLRNPVHLTQGPPGTGKSYLGVVLVRALIIIRKIWIRKSKTAGSPPILVLSYKNLAIDNFLVDLVKVEPLRNQLIRIGGSCKDQRLVQYSERSTFQSDVEVKATRSTVEKLNRLRDSIQAGLSGSVASFLSYQALMFVEGDETTRRQAGNKATEFLMESIIKQKMILDSGKNCDNSDSCTPASVISDLAFLEAGQDGQSCRQVKRLVEAPTSGSEFVTALVDENLLYQDEHWGDLLLKWLYGKKPLPLCAHGRGESDSCNALALSQDIPLCDEHRCSFENNSSSRCSAPCIGHGSFCVDHCCTVTRCFAPRLDIAHMYCNSHACKKCVELGEPARCAIDKPPRNVCELHPLCTYPLCTGYCIAEGIYCGKHSFVRCMATTKRGNPCRGEPLSVYKPFCRDHVHLARSMELDTTSIESDDVSESSNVMPQIIKTERTKCVAQTKKGRPCKGRPLPGSAYCYDHVPPPGFEAPSALQLKYTAVASHFECEGESIKMVDEVFVENASDASQGPKEDSVVERDAQSVASSEGSATSGLVEETIVKTTADADEADLESVEGENLQHLRDVFEVSDDDCRSINSIDEGQYLEVQEDDKSTNASFYSASQSLTCPTVPTKWSWDMVLDQRWQECQNLMVDLRAQMNQAHRRVKQALIVARSEHQRAKTRAKSRVYENKTVIGGTMVGCITRLDSIRAIRPFAVVVEEASEVLEPLLFSCLSEATVKLEMIGDHRQLHPSIMSRFDFEKFNNINVSMFQRLIEAPTSNKISSTVLSVQRRMRKNICDLTREYYADVIEIKDHDTCNTKVIEDRITLTSGSQTLQSVATCGREVPGIKPHVFLWTHRGQQKWAHVGASRINDMEADMACSLASYLVGCGVPRSSIAILTPYKGQLMLIRSKLLKDAKYSPTRLLSKNPCDNNVCRVSTVDRFQGDEEDVVICSLVVDESSKTAFVKLKNRMVVLLSRARLGLYILANGKFLGNQSVPKHWSRTLELLEIPGSNDSTSPNVESSDIYTGQCSGSDLILCCPIHRHITKTASSSDSLRSGFCTELCQSLLSCGHACSLSCHWPKPKHQTMCSVTFDSPCRRHGGIITCHQAFLHSSKIPSQTDYKSVLNFYKCPRQVDLSLPCGHVQQLACWEEMEITQGTRPWPICNLPSTSPYTFLSCGHSRAVTCREYKHFTEDPSSVRCEQEADYEGSCGHKKRMKCWEIDQILSGTKIFDCREKVSEALPRCGHKHKLLCGTARSLAKWTGESCTEIGIIFEGQKYGPQDYTCNKQVTIVRQCGHNLKLPCNEAFSRAVLLPPCRNQVKIRHPACGHHCQIACCELGQLGNMNVPEPVLQYTEGNIPAKLVVGFTLPHCHENVKIIRKCCHQSIILCSEVHKPLTVCTTMVKSESPMCGHEVEVPCNQLVEFQKSIWPTTTYSSLCTERKIQQNAKSLRALASLDSGILAAFRSCHEHTTIVLNCGHEKPLTCAEFVSSEVCGISPTCSETVPLHLKCGHEVKTSCAQSQGYLAGKVPFVCTETREEMCWNFDICHQILKVDCAFSGKAACGQEVSWTCSSEKHTYRLRLCSEGIPLDCPGCSLDALEATISSPPAIDIQSMSRMLGYLPDDIIKPLGEDKTFVLKEKKLLQRYLAFSEGYNEWTRPLFDLQRIPCFRHLQTENSSTFDPKLFVRSSSMHGIIAKVMTEANILKLAEKLKNQRITLLCGYASVTKTKVFKVGQSKTKLRAMVPSLLNDNYDSMLYVDKEFSNILVWDPFPMVALFSLTISKEQLYSLAGGVKDSFRQLPNLEPFSIRYDSPPTDIVTGFDVFDSNNDDDSDDDSVQQHQDQSVSVAFAGTLLEGLQVDLDWPGGISSNGILNSTVESDLMDKMQFVNSQAAPFKALPLLQKLLNKADAQKASLLHLLLAAEMTVHDPNRARVQLQNFVWLLRESATTDRIHPWCLIVAARLEEQETRARNLLSLFVTLFPSHQHILLNSERQLIHDEISQQAGASQSWQEQLNNQWHELQERYPQETQSEAMAKLLELTGLRKVKEEALRLWNSALLLQKMNPEARKENAVAANYIFAGNPGSGKTSVARLFASILCDSGVRQNNVIEELTAQQAKDGGTDEFRKAIAKAMNGVLFIDEAYDLDPIGDFKGKPIVNELLTLCENKRDEISVILAGYEDDFEKKFFAYNDGLKSRFRICHFEDFDEKELRTIWTDILKKKGWEEEEGVCQVMVKRLIKRAGRKGFGNAREVRSYLEQATQSAMSRLGHDAFSMKAMKLKIEDVIGQDPRLSNEKLKRVMDEIQQKIGWGRVKKNIAELIKLCGVNYERELLGQPPLEVFLNRIFLGNPGTGKTTCAKLYGRLLKELGFLSNGSVVSKTASDFVGQFVGDSQNKTSQILNGAQGKVLIIDEAYVLDDKLYGKQVLDTLVEKVQGGPSDDIVVLLLGYEEQMLAMLRNQNPGLARRFPKDHAFYFDDYSDDELLEIINFNIENNKVKASLEFKMKALEVLQQQRLQANFGNAGAAELLVKGAMIKSVERLGPSYSSTITLEDADIDDPGTARAQKNADPLQQLDVLYRMEKVKAKLEKMKKTWTVSQQDGDEKPKLGHFVFMGNPGTGKTTVARTIASVLFSLGLLPSDKIVETSALELTGDYVGQTKTKVNISLSEAKGGVLFIDEAYNLAMGPYGKEACDTIVQAMTSEQFKDVVIVIAGYPYEIDQMLQSNAGLKSRFTNYFEFPDWEPDDCKSFFGILAEKKRFTLSDGVLDEVKRGCTELMALDGWGNGRDVTKLWENAKADRDARVFDSEATAKIIELEDMRGAMSDMLKARQPKPPVPSIQTRETVRYQRAAADVYNELESRPMPAVSQDERALQTEGTEVDDGISEVSDEVFSTIDVAKNAVGSKNEEIRDEGVPDEIWYALQEAKKCERERMEELQREEEAYQQFLIAQAKEEIEAQLRLEEEQKRIRREMERHEQEMALRKALEAEQRREHDAEMKRMRMEEARQRREEEIRKKEEMRQRLQTIMPCPMGFSWIQMGPGWRCCGGSHYVSNAELKERFGADL